MPLMTFDRVLKVISTILNILSVALSALQGLDTEKEEGE